MKILLLCCVVMGCAGGVWADGFFTKSEMNYGYRSEKSEAEKSEFKYNPYQNRFSYEPKSSEIRYNAYENTFEYAPKNSVPVYNPYENKFEFPK